MLLSFWKVTEAPYSAAAMVPTNRLVNTAGPTILSGAERVNT
jgi:hypothetical protein